MKKGTASRNATVLKWMTLSVVVATPQYISIVLNTCSLSLVRNVEIFQISVSTWFQYVDGHHSPAIKTPEMSHVGSWLGIIQIKKMETIPNWKGRLSCK